MSERKQLQILNPARKNAKACSLTVGAGADVAVLRLVHGEFGFVDSANLRMKGDRKLVGELTLRDGRVVWDLDGMTSEEWDHARHR